MSEAERLVALLDEVARVFDPLAVVLKGDGDLFHVDLVGPNGAMVWPDYASGPTRVLATLPAEQRYLVEEVGRGSISGTTYLDKARQRMHQWLTGPQP